ncbi:TIGR04141 family sporadically distributed protein [Burkholderia gladioli]|uniref:TIGR04141 family sporadically distributed protein n=1 Tax=Burkholderia gladioli TaxID=28095 RepID=UPI001641F748|nr:TIGR04141 family sporadically distributed protein [Burkholderia gladioli]
MSAEKKVNHLTVFLIKKQYKTCDEIICTESCEAPFSVNFSGHGEGQLYIKRVPPFLPKWTALFRDQVDLSSYAVPGISAAFFIRINGRCFVLTFGQGGRFLLRDEVFEERFGLLCALNSVDKNSFRCIDVQSLDAIQSHTRIQSGQETSADQFGLDVEQDMLKAIVGAPIDHALGNRMAGSDSLAVSVKMDLSDLPFLLDEYRKRFESDLSAEDYQWVNNISMVRNSELVSRLEVEIDKLLGENKFDNIWLSIPEIIDWGTVKGFMYAHGKREVYPDINFSGFLKTLKSGDKVNLELLRTREVHCADADCQKTFKSWKVFKCLYAEVDLLENKYILNDGKWFRVEKDFVKRTDEEFAKTPLSSLKLPEYVGGGEGAYNSMVAANEPLVYALLDDKMKIMHGGGHGQVEVCDLFSINRELIHVKVYSKSSVLSHLFAQGFVSGQLIQIDASFRAKVREKLPPAYRNLIPDEKKPGQDEFTIVYAIISDAVGDWLHLPFFSRVNLNNMRKILVGYGYKVELLKIFANDIFSKTIKDPPKYK